MSAFKTLLVEMLGHEGVFEKINAKMRNNCIKCFVKETTPHFLISDGSFFIRACFTEEAYSLFKEKYPGINITDLKDKIIVIDKWSLEFREVNSAEVFTSYGNIELRLIVHRFKTNLDARAQLGRYPTNLFRDDEAKTLILAYQS